MEINYKPELLEHYKFKITLTVSVIGLIVAVITTGIIFPDASLLRRIFGMTTSTLMLINVAHLLYTKKTRLSINIMIFVVFVTLPYSQIYSPFGSIVLFWYFLIPQVFVLLLGRNKSKYIISAFMVEQLCIGLGSWWGTSDNTILLEILHYFFPAFVASYMVTFFNQNVIEIIQLEAYQQQAAEKQALQSLSKEVSVRKSAERDLLASIDEVKKNNTELENTKTAMLNLLEDIEDEKKRVLLEKEKINTIIQSIADGIFVIDNEGKIILTNSVALSMAENKETSVIGKHYSEIFCFKLTNEQAKCTDFIADCLSTAVVQKNSQQMNLVTSMNNIIPVTVSAAPLFGKDSGVSGSVVILRNITQERMIDTAKSEFISLASHQLRTPLTIINWYSEMLINDDTENLSELQKSNIGEISQAAKRMTDLVSALLNVSRIELGKFIIQPKPEDLVELIKRNIHSLEFEYQKKQIQLEESYPDNLPLIPIDIKLINIVLDNLLTNAIKYTSLQGTISVKVAVENEINVRIDVSNNGIGIPALDQSKIFSKLFRARNVRDKVTDGTGLGLYIAKSIITESGGSMWFASVENENTTFSVLLPLSGMKERIGEKELN